MILVFLQSYKRFQKGTTVSFECYLSNDDDSTKWHDLNIYKNFIVAHQLLT